MVGICLEECNKISTVTRRVKGQSTKTFVPCPDIIKDYSLDQKTAAYKLDRKSSGERFYLRFFFYLTDIFVVKCM